MHLANSFPSTARILAASASMLLTTQALAHDGHGLGASSHWHNTDAWGFVALAVAVGAAIWLSKGRK